MKEVEEQGYRNVTLITDKGTKMKVDLAIPCTGLKTHSVAYKDSLGRYISKHAEGTPPKITSLRNDAYIYFRVGSIERHSVKGHW